MEDVTSRYQTHHESGNRYGFSMLEKERGALFRELIGQGKSVLDLGCRDGQLTAAFLPGNRVAGADIDDVALARAAEKGIEPIHLDLLGSWHELGNRQFDVIVAGEVIEHLFFPAEVLDKVLAHLAPTGILVGSVPNAFNIQTKLRFLLEQKRNTPLADPTHVNHFSRRELAQLLATRFREVSIYPLGKYAWLDRVLPGAGSHTLAFCART